MNPSTTSATMGQALPAGASVLVLGGGYTGQRFAAAVGSLGASVTLTHRGPEPPEADAPGRRWLRFDPAAGAMPTAEQLAGTSHVLVTIPPDGEGRDPALDALGPVLRQLPLQWLGYLSTTGVYGDLQGAWADEGTPPNPGLGRSRARLACEQAWLGSGLPVQSFRLPAIYGPGRCPFQNLLTGKGRLVHKPGQVFCRIHVDDIVGALLHCLALPPQHRPAVVNVSDDVPCPSSETLGYGAHLLGCPLPPAQRYADVVASMGPMALSFWSENRRVSNRLLCQGLGYRLRYPSYREGFQASLAEERQTASAQANAPSSTAGRPAAGPGSAQGPAAPA
ncbi:NAD-binding protein [Vulcanococcus limneticus]|uniref:NAD-binding protein n=2 Tax=Vulcanococcus limneticus TaxID=2170428 RepID=UPI001E29B736|nr:NAD-binding protein [Vulcanococcus limneticus]